MNSNLKGYLGIARKAGYLIIGGDNLDKDTKKLYLILIDKTSGKNLQKNMNFIAEKRKIEILYLENLSSLVDIDNCKAVGIRNKGLSEKIKILVEEGE